jgi:cardiolipin synthase (CMP-forming)
MSTSTEETPLAADRVWTIPNLLSLLRLLGVPVFLWLVLGPHANGWAFAILAFGGVSDYADGKIARRFNQSSRLGALLDPAADRLYIVATIVALTIRGILPLWLAVAIPARDLLLVATVPVLRRLGYGFALPVNFAGKAATLNLLYAFPLLLVSVGDGVVAEVARPLGWAFTAWGAALYWWAGGLYVVQVRRLAAAGWEPAPQEVAA